MNTPFDTCSVCPRLCRDVCPVATVSEAGVPSFMGRVLRDHAFGRASSEDAQYVATLCTDCGACEDACHVKVPFLENLRAVRQSGPNRSPAPPPSMAASGAVVVVETDDRPLADLVAKRTGKPMLRWRTADACGAAAMRTAEWGPHAEALQAAFGEATMVVAHGGAAEALTAAGLAVVWADHFVGQRVREIGSCARGNTRPLACCGGAGPLLAYHPDEARRVGRLFLERSAGSPLGDARCRDHLSGCGTVSDFVDVWVEAP